MTGNDRINWNCPLLNNMLPPRFSLIPASIFHAAIPIHLKWTYIVLYGLAWQHDYSYVEESYEQLADLFSELEDQEITARGVRERFQQLSNYNLIERRKENGAWRTYLILRHDDSTATPAAFRRPDGPSSLRDPGPRRESARASDAPSVTCDRSPRSPPEQVTPGASLGPTTDAAGRHLEPPGDAAGRHLLPDHDNNHDDDDLFQSSNLDKNHHHHDIINRLTNLRLSITRARQITNSYSREFVIGWLRFVEAGWSAGRIQNPAGYLLTCLAAGDDPPPLAEKEDPGRYTRGRFSDFIES